MSTSEPSSRSSIGKRVIAFLVLLVAAWILFNIVLSIATAIAVVLVAVIAIVAVIWAIRVL